MTELKKERDTITAKYGKLAPVAGRGQPGVQRARGTQTKLTATQRAEKRAAFARWQVHRDALFAESGLTARTQARST